MEEIFDRKAIFQRREKLGFDGSLHEKIEAELLEELEDYLIFFCKNIDKKEKITQILPWHLEGKHTEFVLAESDKMNIENLKKLEKSNGFVAANCLHNVNYLQEYLTVILENLNDGGFFVGSFFGVNNLSILKNVINENDLQFSKQIYPRFNPTISGENVHAILQGTGFGDVVVAVSKINFEFISFGDAMAFLRKIGERNYIKIRQKTAPRRKIFQENLAGKVKLDFEIIKFYCHKR